MDHKHLQVCQHKICDERRNGMKLLMKMKIDPAKIATKYSLKILIL